MAKRVVCTCDRSEDALYSQCEIHVHCDNWCQALQEPETLEETRATMIHWREHPWLSGCSHGE